MAGNDPYKYFRVEAREILEKLGRGVLQLEKEPGAELLGTLLRLAHTLKGAARVVKQSAIAEHTHAIEDALAPLRMPGTTLGSSGIDQILKRLDQIGVHLAAIDAPVAATAPVTTPAAVPSASELSEAPAAPSRGRAPLPGPASGATEEVASQTVRAEVAEMDHLLEGISEAAIQLRALRQTVATAERARALGAMLLDQLGPERLPEGRRAPAAAVAPRLRALAMELAGLLDGLGQAAATGVDQAERQLQEVRDAAERLRLLPVGGLFGPLERAARDGARALGKTIAFEASGGELRVDAHVFGTIQGALVQMVRNAVAHGIESSAERSAAGKPAVGRVSVEVLRRGNRVTFACQDDGAGIDLRAVRDVARKGGLLPSSPASDDGALDSDALLGLLLRGGLTTTRTVTELSGRGIGLDIVRAAASRLGGEVTAHTQPGQGTTLRLTVPVQVSSLDALMVESDGITAAIPLHGVRGALRLGKGQVARAADGDSIVHDGTVIPFVQLTLAGSTRPQAAPRGDELRTAIVVDGNTARAAIGVDRLLGIANVVVRPLPRFAPAEPWIAGAALDREGTPQLVIDPDGLVGLAHAAPRMAALAAKAQAAILVIDDSLTTRMLEQSILESAGYAVELANSAEEGMDKARLRTYDLFLVDVEMPGMDGFTFVERTRADPVLRATPAILVTSRNAPEDRKRGADAGASAYVVKGDFDQGFLLETIRKLVGQ